MSNLIITLIALTVFVLFMGSGTNYMSFDSILIHGDSNKISTALVSYHSGINTYKVANNTLPSDFVQFIPGIISEPALPEYMSVNSYNKNSLSGVAEICFDVSLENKKYFSMLDKISAKEGYLNLVVSDACGASSHEEPLTYPAQVLVTYYIR